jgi:pimeloyl-ACP methyl ester carboxylesterase
VSKPRLLLVPEFTEIEWVNKPRFEEWAEVASYDPPGVGGEPLPEGNPRSMTPAVFAGRGLREIERQGWDRCFLVADGWAIPSAVRIASAAPERIRGLALGHARLSHGTEGERAPINGEVLAALTQLINQDYESFIRYGIAQVTRGMVSEELAQRMVERFPSGELMEIGWEKITTDDTPIESMLRDIDRPLLLAKHEGCLVSTPEGFEDAIAAFPDARTFVTPEGPTSDPAFSDALRSFCLEVAGTSGTGRGRPVSPRPSAS